MKLIIKIIFYSIIVVLSTAIGVIIAIGNFFWKTLVIGMVMILCFLGFWMNRSEIKSEWNSFLIRWIRHYLSLRNWTRRIMIRFSLWILGKLMDRRKLPLPPPHRCGPGRGSTPKDNQDEKIPYYINQIGLS